MSTDDLGNVLTNLMNTQRSLISRVGDLEKTPDSVPDTTSQCLPTEIVTAVTWNRFSEAFPLSVDTDFFCLSRQ